MDRPRGTGANVGLKRRHRRLSLYGPASSDDVTKSISCALTYQGTRRDRHEHRIMARINAEGLAELLEEVGFVVMPRTAPGPASTSGTPNAYLTIQIRELDFVSSSETFEPGIIRDA